MMKTKMLIHDSNEEMKIMNEIKIDDPERLKSIFQRSEELVQLCEEGSFRKTQSIIEQLNSNEFIPIFFVNKMLESSLVNGHLMLAGYILDQGYPLSSRRMPSILHQVFSKVSDDLAEEILRLFITKQYDVNTPAYPHWFTTIHVAVKFGLLKTVKSLVEIGCDVNAVAKDDIMPLHLAEALPSSQEKTLILELLKSRGARGTWRQTTPVTPEIPKVQYKSFSSLTNETQVLPPQPPSTSQSSQRGENTFQNTSVSCKYIVQTDLNNNSTYKFTTTIVHDPLPFHQLFTSLGQDLEFSNNRSSESGGEGSDANADEVEISHYQTSDDGGMMFSTG